MYTDSYATNGAAAYSAAGYGQGMQQYRSPMQESMEAAHSQMMPVDYYSNAAANFRCGGCGLKSVVSDTPFCSRRCSWLASCRCPQCGRFREPNVAYCSPMCCQQALQANWCPVCGVCQISTAGTCTNAQCAGASMFLCNDNRRPKRSGHRSPHDVLSASDTNRASLNSAFGQAFAQGTGSRIVSVIKINPIGSLRKRYLSHRSVVDTTMSALGMAKYGHGGEGNEQRRYMPLTLQCSLGSVAAPGNYGATGLQCCGQPGCEVCQVLLRGVSLQEMGRASHYCTTTVAQCLPWATPNPSNLRAILVARVIVGNPDLIHLTGNEAAPPEINIPSEPELVHSTILTNNDPTQDGTYVFRDDAVDPLFLVVVE